MKILFNVLRIVLCSFYIFFAACTDSSVEKQEYAVKINDYTISSEEIDKELKAEAELESNFYISKDIRQEFIDDLIQKQLLIQEAKKNKLDEREKFRKTIQKYWESTLIRDVLEEKAKEIRQATMVTEEEITKYYNDNKGNSGAGSFEEIKQEMAQILLEKKVAKKMEEWIAQLREESNVDVRQ